MGDELKPDKIEPMDNILFLRKRIAELEAENNRLREAHQKNADQMCKNEYRLRKHLCEWREIADAMRQRSEAVLKEVEDKTDILVCDICRDAGRSKCIGHTDQEVK